MKLRNPNHSGACRFEEMHGKSLEIWRREFWEEEKEEFRISLKLELRRGRPTVIFMVTRGKNGPKESLRLCILKDPKPGGRAALWWEGGLCHSIMKVLKPLVLAMTSDVINL
jgi:hypothetical protein